MGENHDFEFRREDFDRVSTMKLLDNKQQDLFVDLAYVSVA